MDLDERKVHPDEREMSALAPERITRAGGGEEERLLGTSAFKARWRQKAGMSSRAPGAPGAGPAVVPGREPKDREPEIRAFDRVDNTPATRPTALVGEDDGTP